MTYSVMLERFPWDGSPAIGWWKDQDPVTFYHGTNIANLDRISRMGILSPSVGSTAGWVSLALEPNTSHGYASMTGGETNFRSAGMKARTLPEQERAVLIVSCPMAWVIDNMDPRLRGNTDRRTKLLDKAEYDAFEGADSEYYQLTEIRVRDSVPPEMVIGYMIKRPSFSSSKQPAASL